MSTASRYRGWRYAPLRFVVWVLAFVLLGRMFYNNSLYDLRQLTATRVVFRLLAIAVVTTFAWWTLFVADTRVMLYILTTVGLFISSRILLWRVVKAKAESAEARDTIDRRKHRKPSENDTFSEVIDNFATDDRLQK